MFSFVSASAFAQQKITISDLTWKGAEAIAHVIKAIVEGPLDSEAEIVSGFSDGSLIAEGMDKGDGSMDVYTDLWMPNRQGIWDKYIDGTKTVGHNKPYTGTQYMYVPTYMAGEVKSIDDLKKPEIAAKFDKDGNGKGEYWAGDAGWKSTRTWQVKFKSYGLSDLWEPEIVPDATFKAQLKAAYANQEPILFYYWTPEWIHAAYDITPVGEPARTPGCQDEKLDAEDWLEASSYDCISEDAQIYVAYSKSLEKRNPPVAKFLKQMQMTTDMVNGWVLKIGRDEMDPQDFAEEWIAENKAIVNKWIK